MKSYNPIERGRPAIWIEEPIEREVQCSRLIRELRAFPDTVWPIDIVIDSNGGRCDVGLDMYTALRECPRRKRVTILNARSMAAVIAMAGDHIRIVEDGTLFLHHSGYAREMLLNEAPVQHMPALALRRLARSCEATDFLHLQIFARRTKLQPSVIAELRSNETTLDACRAVELGFADVVVGWPADEQTGGKEIPGSFRGISGEGNWDRAISVGAGCQNPATGNKATGNNLAEGVRRGFRDPSGEQAYA